MIREEKDNPGRKNRQVVPNLEMKGLVQGKDSPCIARTREVGGEGNAS